ncbi:hypothetical protein KIW84_013436 [Lathyrus oleraceus]|uniref:DUF7745 domain-containing protein n=1 Tax=Pisum sativum TaxID=3888 RepID=A0A9D5BKC1_PEA|nr:hypothetical protein KIW84_013436 [Pisum sativum]
MEALWSIIEARSKGFRADLKQLEACIHQWQLHISVESSTINLQTFLHSIIQELWKNCLCITRPKIIDSSSASSSRLKKHIALSEVVHSFGWIIWLMLANLDLFCRIACSLCKLDSNLNIGIGNYVALILIPDESDVSPAIDSRFPVRVFVGSESDVSPAIGIRFPCLPVCVESDVSPAIGSRFPVWFCLACVSRATSALILLWSEKIILATFILPFMRGSRRVRRMRRGVNTFPSHNRLPIPSLFGARPCLSQVHSGVYSLIEMATVPELKRKTCSYSFHREPLTSLIELSNLVTNGNQKGFVDQYGDILTLLKMVPFLDVPKEVDFRVVARALHLSVKEVSDNWKSSGDVVGLPLKFLSRIAREEAEKGNWEAFHAQLAIMIYGIILFPSMPNFVDYAAVTIFLGGNPFPTLLADTYYAIHSRHGKGGAIRCCLPLLLRWFMSLLSVSGPFVDAQSTHKWTQRVMSLTSYDIRWQSYQMDMRNVIMSCGEFRNMPLVGTKGCINYNPVLSLRQLGFVMIGKPLDAEIVESVYFEKRSDPVRVEQIGRAWKTIGVKDGAILGKKFAIAMPDYTEWVKKRVETLLLPMIG